MPATVKRIPAKKTAAKAAKKSISKKTAKKTVAKKSAAKKPAAKKAAKKVVKKTPVKKAAASKQISHGIQVRNVVSEMDPKISLTDDAVELLNALLNEKFTQIASSAVKIVHKGKQNNLDCAGVKKAVNQVFVEKFK